MTATALQTRPNSRTSPEVEAFFHKDTNTVSYVARDPASRSCAIIDPVLDYDPHSGRTSTDFADRIADYVGSQSLVVEWILETHAHADHLTSAVYLRDRVGGKTAIGKRIRGVQTIFADIYNLGDDFVADGSQFDRLFEPGDRFTIGGMHVEVMSVPGHTGACSAYLIGNSVFVGDTLFMPDYGTARCDFPGGDAATLFRSVKALYALPDKTRVFLCHDYLPEGRSEYAWETTIGEQKRNNIHIRESTTEAEFVTMREARDATLGLPRLIIPSIQVNIRGGHFPPPEDNDVSYLKIPVNRL